MTDESDPLPAAMGHVALNLSVAIFHMMIAKDVISPAVAHDILDRMLMNFENDAVAVDDATTRAARLLVERLAGELPPRGKRRGR